MRKKDATTGSGSGWSSAPAGRLTPLDVQQKEFRVTRVGVGYRMREVDEFLDQVTDALSALIAENERLRAAGGPGPGTSAWSAAGTAPADAADRGDVEAFLRREKGFLEDLGGLVQAHAEELRSMVRTARRAAAEPPAATAPATGGAGAAPSPETDVTATAVAEAPAAPPGPVEARPEDPGPATAGTAAPRDEPQAGALVDDVDEVPDGGPRDAIDADEGAGPTSVTGGGADEPIRLDEPEPARSRRSEEEGDSLRELFWGED